MADYTAKNLKRDVENMAPKFGMAPGMEARFARNDLELEKQGVSYFRFPPDMRMPFAHRHGEQEEVYVVVTGLLRVKVEDDIVELGPFDALRVAGHAARSMEAGPEGVELIAVGAPFTDNKDAEPVPDFWTD